MLSVTITEKDGPSTTTTFDKTEVLIGRVKGNDVVLPKTNVSKRHSRIVVKDGKVILVDLKSTNGTFVNGRKITAPHMMQEGDKVFIGDFTIEVQEVAPAAGPSPVAMGHPGMPSFGAVPSVASLPSIGSPHAHEPMMANPMPEAGPAGHSMPNYGRPQHSAPSGVGPQMGASPSMVPPPSPGLAGPGLVGPGLSGMPSLGLGGGAASSPMGPAGSQGMGPGQNAQVHMGPSNAGPSLGLNVNAPGPNPGHGQASPASIAMGPSLGAGPAARHPSSQTIAPINQHVGAEAISKPSSLNAAPTEGVIEKALRPSNAASVERNLGQSSARAVQGVAHKQQDLGSASLPEDIVVDDARSAESEGRIKAARLIMDIYLSQHDFQDIVSQAYPPEAALQDSCYNKLVEIVNQNRGNIGNVDVDVLLDLLLKEACGLGAIDSLIDDENVSDFVVYNAETIVSERNGRREISDQQFTSADTLYLAAQRLLSFQNQGTQVSAINEIRLGDGTQIEIVLPPVSVSSTYVVVRKTSRKFSTLATLSQKETLSPEMMKFLLLAIKARRNILVVGAQGSGRTSILNALGSEIPDGERIVTVENSAMMLIPQLYVLSLEAQNSSYQHGNELSALIRQASRLRAERVLVDSLQSSKDVTAFLGVIYAGAQGSMAAMSGLSASEGFNNFLRIAANDSSSTLKAGVAGAIDLVVATRAFTDSRRRIVEISEVVTLDNGSLTLVPIFEWVETGMGSAASGGGRFKACGNIPRFYKELERGGVSLDPTIFNV